MQDDARETGNRIPRTTMRSLAVAVALAALLAAGPAGAGFSGNDLFLPTVAHAPGQAGTTWFTDVWVYNPNDTAVTTSFYLLERGKANTAVVPVIETIQPGDTKEYGDIVATMFGKAVWGALRIATAEDKKVVVSCRVYNQLPGRPTKKDSTGQDFAGVPASFAIGLGEKTNILGAYTTLPASGSDFRFRYGFVEVTGNSVKVRVTPLDETGAALASPKEHQILASSQNQYSFEGVFTTVSTTNMRLQVEVVAGSGKAIAYGLTVANGTIAQDPTTFEMQFKDSLLESGGLTAVAHDGTLTGDGTSGSPLGVAAEGIGSGQLAAGAVTPPKVSPGDTVGQVLKTVVPPAILGEAARTLALAVAWEPDGLSLPFSGSGLLAGPLFQLENADPSWNSTAILGVEPYGAGVQAFGGDTGVVGVSALASAPAASATSRPGGRGGIGRAKAAGASDGFPDYPPAGVAGLGLDAAPGVFGISNGSNGVMGFTTSAGHVGVFGLSVEASGPALAGLAAKTMFQQGFTPAGVFGGSETNAGVAGMSSSAPGVFGFSSGLNGVIGDSGDALWAGVYGLNEVAGGLAGWFDGDVVVNGDFDVFGGTKNFRIDHPLDPENKVLVHAAVESSEVLDVYSGNVVLDGDGSGVVQLPDWFEAINADIRYQLTSIGGFAPVYVAEEVSGNRFRIAGGKAGMKISWQLTARRNDAWMRHHPFVAERDKVGLERGLYLTPVEHGQPEEKGVRMLRREPLKRLEAQLGQAAPAGK